MMVGAGFIRSSGGLLAAAQLPNTLDPVVSDDEDSRDTALAAQRESTAELETRNLIESYWNWFYFAMNMGALFSYTFISYLCQVRFLRLGVCYGKLQFHFR